MTSPARRFTVAQALTPVAVKANLRPWREWLTGQLAAQWRRGEWDATAWLFTGDTANPATQCRVCAVVACATVTGNQLFCDTCARDFARQPGADQQQFAGHHQPSIYKRYMGPAMEPDCIVEREGVRCARAADAGRVGLCPSHTTQWRQHGKPRPITAWAITKANPLPVLDTCAVLGCPRQRRVSIPLCPLHLARFRADQPLHHGGDAIYIGWAQQMPHLAANQFSLAPLAETVQVEMLYGLQQRDLLGKRLAMEPIRAFVRLLANVDTLTDLRLDDVGPLFRSQKSGRAHAIDVLRAVHLAYDEFHGIDPTDRPVWDLIAVGIPSAFDPSRKRTNNARCVADFTTITQPWLRDLAMCWARTVRPVSLKLTQTIWACTVASQVLTQRPTGGPNVRLLKFADMVAVVDGFRHANSHTGRAYGDKNRAALLSLFLAVLDFGRANEMLAELPGAFGRHADLRIKPADPNEDEIGKAIPEPVIAQLDSYLHLLGEGQTYGPMAFEDVQAMLRTVYFVLRDTGRRPLEVYALPLDCLEIDNGDYSMIYHNYKKRRHGRRLPITAATAAEIQTWQRRRKQLDLPESAQRWLFPAMTERTSKGHLAGNKMGELFRAWLATIPVLDSDLPGPDGHPLPFDKALIFPYAFRFSYAQRHADAGVPVEVLKELMDHRDISATQGYYKVSLKRKREAVKVMSRFVHDRVGSPVAGGSISAYELKSVSVPFGNCREPSNVNAGGKACPIRFQCAGCGFYRPDPSYLPAIAEHVNSLRADREIALAMDVAPFVIHNLDEQVGAFTQVATIMQQTLDILPAEERAEVEEASRILRKARAGHNPKMLPLIASPPSPR